jgi:uncharacterized protein (TIGR01777 family)
MGKVKDKSMKVVVAGGTGFIGRRLIDKLQQSQYEVTLLSRVPERAEKIFPSVYIKFWDAQTSSGLTDIFEGTDAIINLTGESIAARRWTSDQKKRILASRVESTRAIVNAITQVNRRPSLLINASASGYYGNVPEDEVTETYPKGRGFLADVCEQWEGEASKVQEYGVRVVLLRTGIVLDRKGGALQKLLIPFRLFIGGPFGFGKQWFPWIHSRDEVGAILFAVEHEQITGPINLSAPESVRMKNFSKVLGKVLHRPSLFAMPAFILKLVMGEMAEPLLLQGQRMVPKKLTDAGIKFKFPKLEEALTDILYQ